MRVLSSLRPSLRFVERGAILEALRSLSSGMHLGAVWHGTWKMAAKNRLQELAYGLDNECDIFALCTPQCAEHLACWAVARRQESQTVRNGKEYLRTNAAPPVPVLPNGFQR